MFIMYTENEFTCKTKVSAIKVSNKRSRPEISFTDEYGTHSFVLSASPAKVMDSLRGDFMDLTSMGCLPVLEQPVPINPNVSMFDTELNDYVNVVMWYNTLDKDIKSYLDNQYFAFANACKSCDLTQPESCLHYLNTWSFEDIEDIKKDVATQQEKNKEAALNSLSDLMKDFF